MTLRINNRWRRTTHASLTAALWAAGGTGWLLLLLADRTLAYLAAALLAAMGACTRIAIASNSRNMTKFTEELRRSNDVSAALADVATATAFRGHADHSHEPHPLTDLEGLRPGGWSQDFYYDRSRTQFMGDAVNVVPIREHPRRTAS